ncbi:hypothetical protein ACHWQZ_G017570 [Mnemiopsis leidyi]
MGVTLQTETEREMALGLVVLVDLVVKLKKHFSSPGRSSIGRIIRHDRNEVLIRQNEEVFTRFNAGEPSFSL